MFCAARSDRRRRYLVEEVSSSNCLTSTVDVGQHCVTVDIKSISFLMDDHQGARLLCVAVVVVAVARSGFSRWHAMRSMSWVASGVNLATGERLIRYGCGTAPRAGLFDGGALERSSISAGWNRSKVWAAGVEEERLSHYHHHHHHRR